MDIPSYTSQYKIFYIRYLSKIVFYTIQVSEFSVSISIFKKLYEKNAQLLAQATVCNVKSEKGNKKKRLQIP